MLPCELLPKLQKLVIDEVPHREDVQRQKESYLCLGIHHIEAMLLKHLYLHYQIGPRMKSIV